MGINKIKSMKLQKKKGKQGKTKRKKKYKNTKGNRTKIHKNSVWTSDERHVGRIWTALTTWKPKANREIHQLFL